MRYECYYNYNLNALHSAHRMIKVTPTTQDGKLEVTSHPIDTRKFQPNRVIKADIYAKCGEYNVEG